VQLRTAANTQKKEHTKRLQRSNTQTHKQDSDRHQKENIAQEEPHLLLRLQLLLLKKSSQEDYNLHSLSVFVEAKGHYYSQQQLQRSKLGDGARTHTYTQTNAGALQFTLENTQFADHRA
jgi:hypothetical protein